MYCCDLDFLTRNLKNVKLFVPRLIFVLIVFKCEREEKRKLQDVSEVTSKQIWDNKAIMVSEIQSIILLLRGYPY